MLRSWSLIAFIALLTAGCVTVPVPQPPTEKVPAETTTTEETVAASRDHAFDAALAVAQELNLNVDVLEKASGLLKFENAFLSAEQLDRYCNYPWQLQRTKEPFDTFANWDIRSRRAGGGPVKGNVALNVLMKEVGPAQTVVSIRTTLSAGNRNETEQCNSTGVELTRFGGHFILKVEEKGVHDGKESRSIRPGFPEADGGVGTGWPYAGGAVAGV